jgi:hypothetical protein
METNYFRFEDGGVIQKKKNEEITFEIHREAKVTDHLIQNKHENVNLMFYDFNSA